MSDADALLNAIAAHPDEDTPRLMYADWLDEHGQSIRAEFIRVQIEIARKEHLPRAELNRYVPLYERNQELIDNHRTELLGPLAELPDDVRIEFRRGFVASVDLFADQFVPHADALSSLNPRPDIALLNFAPALDLLADVSHSMELVTCVRMNHHRHAYPMGLAPADVWNIFVECWPWDRLRELDMGECSIGDEGVANLVSSEQLGSLTDLDLSSNNLTDAAVESLLESTLPRQLKRLVFGGNDITDAGAIALAERWPTGDADRLETLNLRFTQIGQPGQAALLNRFGGRVDLF